MAEQLLTDITTLRRSPLSHLHQQLADAAVAGERGVSLREIPFLTMVGIRVDPATAAAGALAAKAGVPLPAGHGAVTGTPGGTAILWQGPDEFLLVGPEEPAGAAAGHSGLPGDPRAQELVRALGQEPGQVVDLSANRTTLELSGPSARAVLEKGCPMDLHPRVFAVGTAVATTLGPVQVVLWRTAEQTWRIMPRPSFAEYVARWLLDAMTEFASPEVP
ncbi:MAG TPA: sarcosine oxidase subunit gamma family protein [Kocuria rosea]|jgi:sarcosine oxidase subunit gamma|nr:sarcosine oxidase subunit gamma family protein [Kocuria rosea]